MRVGAALAGRGHNGSVGGHGIRAAKRAARRNADHRARTRLETVLGEGRRRVLEDASADERRRDPDRVKRRNRAKVKDWDWSRDQRRRRRLLVVTRADERDRAFMAGIVRVGVEQLVPARRDTERER